MLLHIVAIIAVLFFISVFFYRYSDIPPDFRIIQIEWDQVDTWPELRTEGQPIIIRGAPTGTAPVWTAADCPEQSPIIAGTPAATTAANQHFVTKWTKTWLPSAFNTSPILQRMPLHIYAAFGPQPIRESTSSWTVVAPTDGACTVSIAMPAAAEFLPNTWNGALYHFPHLTKSDTPFVGNIKYIDIKLRPGTLVTIPCHWLYAI